MGGPLVHALGAGFRRPRAHRQHHARRNLAEWSEGHPLLIRFPTLKCGFGILCYLLAVILMSWRDLSNNMVVQVYALVLGVISNSVIFYYIYTCHATARRYNAKYKVE